MCSYDEGGGGGGLLMVAKILRFMNRILENRKKEKSAKICTVAKKNIFSHAPPLPHAPFGTEDIGGGAGGAKACCPNSPVRLVRVQSDF